MSLRIDIDRELIAAFCRQNGIKRLSLFGSALTDRFNDDSDIDLLVEFEPGARVSMFDLGGMIHELSELFGRRIDLRTKEDLSPYFRDEVATAAEPLYAHG